MTTAKLVRRLPPIAAAGALVLAGPAMAADKHDTLVGSAPPTAAIAVPSVPTAKTSRSTKTRMADTGATSARKRHADPVKRWADAAARGDAEAQLKLGRSYRIGLGTTANRDAALRWLTAAARANLAAAHYQLGLLHVSGAGDRQPDLVEAYARFKVASEAGDVRAAALVFYIGARMTAAEMRTAQTRIAEIRSLATNPPPKAPAAEAKSREPAPAEAPADPRPKSPATAAADKR